MESLITVVASSPPVASEYTTSTSEEADEQRNEGTKGQPIGVAVLGADPVVPDDVPGDPPEHHVDDPNNERAEECEARHERHEHGVYPAGTKSTPKKP